MRAIVLQIVALCSVTTCLPSKVWSVGQETSTTSGSVIGHAASDRTQVSEYLGIPYAKPPVGDLRWAAPVKYVGQERINASKYSLDCAATFQDPNLALGLDNANPGGILYLTEMMQLGHPVSEDCLTINIWTKPQTGDKAKAVMFWVYGGGFATGNSANKIYDGQYLADSQDVVVVSFNYRENIFGFPGIDGDETVVKNAGLLDQRLALEWTRDNIAAFGGDPKRIMMFGESAGGASIDFYSYAYVEDPIISGAIVQSGSVTSFSDPQPMNNTRHWTDAARSLNCPDYPVRDSVRCMRSKSTDSILNVTIVANPLQAVLGVFGPTVDGKVVFGDYDIRAKAGQFIKKPYMFGNNDFEAGLFKFIGGAAKIDISSNVWSVFNPSVFNCPIAKAADARANQGLPVWRYRFFGDWSNTNLMPGSGAYHTAEIPMVFGTSASTTARPDEEAQKKVSDFMMKVWAQFAKDPLSISKPPLNLGMYTPDDSFAKTNLIGFGANNRTYQMLMSSNYDTYCPTIVNMVKQIPGGIFGAISNIATGKELGVPGLKTSQLPDMSPPALPDA